MRHAVVIRKKPAAPWHIGSVDDVLRRLDSGRDGLSRAEIDSRRAQYGANVLPPPARPGLAALFVRQFRNPLVYLLLAATAVSLFIDQVLDAIFIFAVLLINALIGAAQEWQAQKSAAELDHLIRHRSIVRRDDAWIEISAHEIVPGDIVRLESGEQVAADLRLLSSKGLLIDESLLTGESVSVDKNAGADLAADVAVADRANMVFAGTTIAAGRGRGIVVATGQATEIGRIAESLRAADTTPPPLLRQLDRLGRVIGAITVVLILAIAVALFAQGATLASVFLIAIALAVAAIPEGLPVAITVALTVAVKRMQRRRVIVRSLPAVEGLGACTLIASDKTGTLTCNQLTVKVALPFCDGVPDAAVDIPGQGYEVDEALLPHRPPNPAGDYSRLRPMAESVALCNEAALRFTENGAEHLGDTVDVAFLVFAAKLGIDLDRWRAAWRDVAVIPYEPERRFAAVMSARRDGAADTAIIAHVKGAAETLVPMCGVVDQQRILAEADRLAEAGYRVLAVASGPVDAATAAMAPERALHDLRLLGLVGLIDPVRPEVPAAVTRCRDAGISVRMITGDHPATALAVARELGIAASADDVAGEPELRKHAPGSTGFADIVARRRVFARVDPVQKLAIVEALQGAGHVVAVTGDGVNDAPALHAADIGVAMGRGGTDVARSAADLVLADDNFASIVAGIEEGRIAYDNIRKLIYLLIATGLGEIVLFVLAILFGLPPPLFAVQLLWLNLVTNGIQDVALAFEKGEPAIGLRRPRPRHEALFDRRMIAQVVVAGAYMGAMSFVAFAWFLSQGMVVEIARNLVLLLMVLFENAHALNARSERRSVFRIPLAANWFLLIAIVSAQGLHVVAMFLPGLSSVLRIAPVGVFDWVVVAVIAASLILIMEAYKRAARRWFED
ncbi:MAG: cation-transporting P-type ATPase [Alphaproteobacteria bacterium]|nr:cation-transporting P-type ATPase [Alphaproteobacteria bacterium]